MPTEQAPERPLYGWWSGRRRLGVEQLSAGIYGTVVVSATMAGAADRSLGAVIGIGIATVVVYWVAEEYAHGLAIRAAAGQVTRGDVLRSLRERFSMVEASFLPLIAVGVVGALGAAVSTAVTVGLIAAAGSLAILGAIAGRRAGMSLLRTLVAGCLAAALGGAVVLFKLALH